MNPDVPGLEACQRLAKAGYDAPAHHFYDTATGKLYGEGLTVSGAASPVTREVAEQLRGVLAPTLGEMLAEIRRRGWCVILENLGKEPKPWACSVWSETSADIGGGSDAAMSADALALALAEAVEKEGKP